MSDVASGVKNLGWRVTFAGLGVNLALGILYTWSVIKKGIPDDWDWTDAEKTLPYSTAVLVFSLMMVPGGRLQDKLGPRLAATIGGLLVSLGMILASFATSPYVVSVAQTIGAIVAPGVAPTVIVYFVGFGLLTGAGIGFGYASATPPAVKWFPPARTGLIAGLVVSGFGLASVYASPLATALIQHYGLSKTLFILGIAFFAIVVGLAQLLIPPPKGYVPPSRPAPDAAKQEGVQPLATAGAAPSQGGIGTGGPAPSQAPVAAKREDFRPMEMLGTGQFYVCWLLYAVGAGAGLMVIPQLATAVAKQADLAKLGFWLVMACGVGNGAGRIVAGMLSDKLGRRLTLQGCFLFQAAVLMLFSVALPDSPVGSLPVMLVLSALVGANYGANLSLFPSIAKDYYGLKNFGVNYGLLFTAWGFGGFLLAQVASGQYDKLGTFAYNYYGAAALLVVAAAAAMLVKPPHAARRQPVNDIQQEPALSGK